MRYIENSKIVDLVSITSLTTVSINDLSKLRSEFAVLFVLKIKVRPTYVLSTGNFFKCKE